MMIEIGENAVQKEERGERRRYREGEEEISRAAEGERVVEGQESQQRRDGGTEISVEVWLLCICIRETQHFL